MSAFIDEVSVAVRAGNGGRGACSFRREKFVPEGGPDGGDGGWGGDVVLVADPQRNTLLEFRYQQRIVAENGQPGKGATKTGRSGEVARVPVPVGTLVYDAETGECLADLASPGHSVVVAKGGKPGWGNKRFASSTDRAPMRFGSGLPGESRKLRLELKLLADVGLVGFPNAGKSTLVAALSRARPKVGDYPFTTLVPSLGVVEVALGQGFVIADIPGLIEGASEGKGLGTQFLRHVERCSLLVYLLAPDPTPGRDPVKDLAVLERELKRHAPALAERPAIVVLNKADLPESAEWKDKVKRAAQRRGRSFLYISGAARQGLDDLTRALWSQLKVLRPQGESIAPWFVQSGGDLWDKPSPIPMPTPPSSLSSESSNTSASDHRAAKAATSKEGRGPKQNAAGSRAAPTAISPSRPKTSGGASRKAPPARGRKSKPRGTA